MFIFPRITYLLSFNKTNEIAIVEQCWSHVQVLNSNVSAKAVDAEQAKIARKAWRNHKCPGFLQASFFADFIRNTGLGSPKVERLRFLFTRLMVHAFQRIEKCSG
jgi:hypothetical protein